MKKILPMILMLSFALPVLAAEVKLVCSWVDKDGDRISKEIAFNEAAKTVSIDGKAYPVDQKVDGHWKPNAEGNYDECYISNIAFGCRSTYRNERDYSSDWSVSRMDGAYQGKIKDGKYNDRGNCVPLKQAF